MRQFVLIHLVKLINILKDIINFELYKQLHEFQFIDHQDKSLEKLTYDLAKKESELTLINPKKLDKTLDKNIDETTDGEKLSNDSLLQRKEEILADLKAQNPELELDNWI